jgi:hypothetical protein
VEPVGSAIEARELMLASGVFENAGVETPASEGCVVVIKGVKGVLWLTTGWLGGIGWCCAPWLLMVLPGPVGGRLEPKHG